jgi:hypothetical protein
MGKNPKLWVLVRVRVLGKAGSVRVRVLCLPSKFGFGSVRVLQKVGFGFGSLRTGSGSFPSLASSIQSVELVKNCKLLMLLI